VRNRFQLQPLARAIALGLPAGVAAITSLQVEAAQVLTLPSIDTKLDTGGNISVTSQALPDAANQVNKSFPPITISRFAPALGVLTQSETSFTITNFNFSLGIIGKLQASPAPASKVIGSANFLMNNISALTDLQAGFTPVLPRIDYTVANNKGCSNSANLTSLPPSLIQANRPSTLDAYAGEKGTVTIAQPSFTVTAISDPAGNPATVTANLKWLGTETTSYSYLNHAAPSFSKTGLETSLTLDFGNLQSGSASGLKWLINNPGDLNTAGLDFDSISTNSTDAGKFNLGASLFSGFAAGGGTLFTASLDTLHSGSFLTDYILRFSDADAGAASTRFNYDLNLTLKGVVSAPVPLPSAWVLMASGLGPFGWKARKYADSGYTTWITPA
jgi:hypothetical protein